MATIEVPKVRPQVQTDDLSFLESREVRVVMFLEFALLLVLPIWLVKYPPLIDYPNHLARAFVLFHLHDPQYHFAQFYAPDWGLNPYFLADFLMQVFQRFLGIYAAGQLLLSLCVLSMPLSVAFFLRRANPGHEYVALWGFTVAYNPNFLMGFTSFQLSIPLCFITVGIWLDYLRTGKHKHWVLTLLLATLTFLTHLGGFAIAGVVLLLYTALICGFGRRLLYAAVVFVPGGLLFVYDKFHGWSQRGFKYTHTTWNVVHKFRDMFVPFREYSRTVEFLTMLAVLATIAYFIWRRQYLRIQYVWIPIVLAIVAIHWVLPDSYGDLDFIGYRFCIFAFLFALAIPVFRGSRTLPILFASTAFLLHIFQVGSYFAAEEKQLARQAPYLQTIPRNSLVLAYFAKGDVPWEQEINLHLWSYGVIDRGWIVPNLFHQSGVQPLRLAVPMYSDDDPYGLDLQSGKYKVDGIRHCYDYIWVRNGAYLDPYLEQMGSRIFASGDIQIFQTHRSWPSAAQDRLPE